MIPFFPSNLDPTIIGSILNNSSSSTNEEAEISELEQEQQKFILELEQLAQDLAPLGRLQSEQNDNESDNSESDNDNEESSEDEADTDDQADNEADSVPTLEMSASFARIFQQAEKTFSVLNAESYKANFQTLKKLVDKLCLSDLNVNLPSSERFHNEDKAPCTFVNLYENKQFSMSIFVLNDNYKMPLHDHPNMCGILKVISGKLKIQSYTRIPSKTGEILVKAESPKIISESSEAAVLLPDSGNYHELTALDGRPAAFYDILSPPYSEQDDTSEDARHCSFYRKIMVDAKKPDPIIRLIKIDCPDHYFCDTYSYEQPDFMR